MCDSTRHNKHMATNTTTWNPPKTNDLEIADAWLSEMGGSELAVHLDMAKENFFDLEGRPAETEEEKGQVIRWAYAEAEANLA